MGGKEQSKQTVAHTAILYLKLIQGGWTTDNREL